MMINIQKKVKTECGAIIVEACIALPIFMFAMMTIFGLYNVGLAQSRVGMALNDTAKEISVYSYLYHQSGLNTARSNLADRAGSATKSLEEMSANTHAVVDQVRSTEISNITSVFSTLSSMGDYGGQVSDFGGDIAENADSYLYYVGNQGIEYVVKEGVGALSKLVMKKHFGSRPEQFCTNIGIVDGLDGIDMGDSKFFDNGKGSEIELVANYYVKPLPYLNIDLKWHIVQYAKTYAWTTGVSQATQKSE